VANIHNLKYYCYKNILKIQIALVLNQEPCQKDACGSGGKTHAFLTSETDADEWSTISPRKEPPPPQFAFLTPETDGDEWSAVSPRKDPPNPVSKEQEVGSERFAT
jgi:hypothetical protein